MTRPLQLVAAAAPQALLGGAVHYLRAGSDAISELEPESLTAHYHRFGPRPSCAGEGGHALLRRLDAAALTGRGGGHFPVAGKWRHVQAARLATASRTVVVANGAEGEPLSRKDSALLELRPHLVLDGLACAAETLDACDAVLWLHEDAHTARQSVLRALAERLAHGCDDPPIRVAVGPSHYLTGESSAVVRALGGGPARPVFARVPAARSGIGGRPTLVQNVESLARIATLARAQDPRTVLLSIAAPDHVVVVEYPEDTALRGAVLATLGTQPPHAVLIGGYGGRWLGWDRAAGLLLRERDLRDCDISLGAGVLLPLATGECGLQRTADIVDFLATSGARQCGPCRFGLPAIAAIMSDLGQTRARRRDTRLLERFLSEVDGRGACHHPDGAVGLVRSALSTFADDVAAHRKGRCLHVAERRDG